MDDIFRIKQNRDGSWSPLKRYGGHWIEWCAYDTKKEALEYIERNGSLEAGITDFTWAVAFGVFFAGLAHMLFNGH